MARPKIAPGKWGAITIRPTPTGNFVARANYRRIDGKNRETEIRGASKSAARAALLDKLGKLVNETGSHGVSRTMPFADLVEQYLAETDATSQLSANTLHEERRFLTAYAIPALGGLALSELSASAVHNVLIGIFKKTPTQARNLRTALRKVYDYGFRLDVSPVNHAAGVKLPKPRHKDIVAPDPAELDVIRDAVRAYMGRPGRSGPAPGNLLIDVIETILGTSCRIGEAVGLRWQDLDLLSDPPTVEIVGKVVEGDGRPKHWEGRGPQD